MKKLSIRLGIIAIMMVLGFLLVGCNMDKSGFKVTWFLIDSEIYYNRPSGVTAEENLEYVDTLCSQNNVYWTSSLDGVGEFLTEKCGNISNLDEIKEIIVSNESSSFYYKPGIVSSVQDYYFFYVKNNNFTN
ncbi:MAG: hypothetical protein IIX47_06600 [Spirochaetaceae bacterium]|nr:hypothetical protein [Spirochaetaceae bacterium]